MPNNCTPEDEERINRLLVLVKGIWMENPDLRFGQLIANAMTKDEDLYYKYDQDMIEALLKRYL